MYNFSGSVRKTYRILNANTRIKNCRKGKVYNNYGNRASNNFGITLLYVYLQIATEPKSQNIDLYIAGYMYSMYIHMYRIQYVQMGYLLPV